MKKVLFLFTLLFFATQIIPIKYIGYLCQYEACDLNCDDDADNDDCPIKLKEKLDTEVYLKYCIHQTYLNSIAKSSSNKFPIYCIKIPKDYIVSILVPPPNC